MKVILKSLRVLSLVLCIVYAGSAFSQVDSENLSSNAYSWKVKRDCSRIQLNSNSHFSEYSSEWSPKDYFAQRRINTTNFMAAYQRPYRHSIYIYLGWKYNFWNKEIEDLKST